LEPEKSGLFEFKPPGLMGERFHLLVAKGPANREARIMANHGVSDNESRKQPNAKRSESAAAQIDAGGPKTRDAGHFPQDDKGILFSKVMEGEAAEDQLGPLLTERELAGISLNKEHFLAGRRGRAGNLEGLKLQVGGNDGDIALTGSGKPKQIPAMVAIAAGQVDQDKPIETLGQLTEDFFDGFFAAKRFVKSRDILQIITQGGFVLIGQIHQFGHGLGVFTLHGARMPIVELASFFFFGCSKMSNLSS
jgi:hypothetical protein